MKRLPLVLALALPVGLAAFAPRASAQTESAIEVRAPRVVLDGIAFDAWVVANGIPPDQTVPWELRGATGEITSGTIAGGDSVRVRGLSVDGSGTREIVVEVGGSTASTHTRALPAWLSILPPLLAITFALLFREVVISLLAGIWLGALFIYDFRPFTALLRTVDRFVIESVIDLSHAQILLFTMFLGGMVGVISRNGGTYGVVDAITRRAVGPIRGQLAAFVMGLVIFFDDYSNSLIVGSTMRPVTDRLKISREKLAYIVDSTAAPVASIALIGGWIGFEVGLIGDALSSLGLEYEPYVVFVQSLPLRFYPILALAFVLMVIVTDRDFGPMRKAERRARVEGKVLRDGAQPASDFDADILKPVEGQPRRGINAILPILVVAIATLLGMYLTGRAAVLADGGIDLSLRNTFASGDSYVSLVWGSFLACMTAVVLTVGQRLLSLGETMSAWLAGAKAMMFAVMILVLAWSMGAITTEVHTADYIVHLMSGVLDPRLLPALVFIASALIAFGTGTSWATMGIMMPIVVPLAVALGAEAGLSADAAYNILLGAVSGVLAGSVWGDHCSPISDTTILSSMASSSDHIDHVRTQLPYALLVGIVAMALGDIPSAYGLSPWLSMLVGVAALYGFLRFFGKRSSGGGGGSVITAEDLKRPA